MKEARDAVDPVAGYSDRGMTCHTRPWAVPCAGWHRLFSQLYILQDPAGIKRSTLTTPHVSPAEAQNEHPVHGRYLRAVSDAHHLGGQTAAQPM